MEDEIRTPTLMDIDLPNDDPVPRSRSTIEPSLSARDVSRAIVQSADKPEEIIEKKSPLRRLSRLNTLLITS